MKPLLKLHDRIRPLFKQGAPFHVFKPVFDAADHFAFTPPDETQHGAHVRDAIDIKRVMMTVIYALLPCFFFGVWNAGYQYNMAHAIAGADFLDHILRGLIIVMPIILVSYAVGGFWEVLFACARRHPINEGLLVSGFLFPLILPPSIPLWQVAVGITFGIVIGKEIFGGTGMNVVNPALLSRAFLFFAYAKSMTGNVWIAARGDMAVDAVTGATPLGILAAMPDGLTVADAIASGQISFMRMFLGVIPGSIGATSALACLLGAFVLLATGVASWRIMLACVLGLLSAATLATLFGDSPMAQIPPHYHLAAGGFAFGAVFMATDPVSGAATKAGKWIYGFLIGALVIIIRVLNAGFPEGVMLAILFMNVMAPLIDSFVVDHHIRRRRQRA